MTGAGAPTLVLFVLLAAGTWLACSGRDSPRTRLRRLQPPRPHGREPAGSPAAAAARTGLDDTAMMLELVAAMLDAGAGIGRSLALVAGSAAPQYRDALRPVVSALAIGADWETAWRSSAVRLPAVLELRDALGFAALTGAPSSAILYAQAARLRREKFRAAEKRAASLGVKLVVPLGLCSLPAFICLGVVPVLLALVPSGT
ncbi:type II secretion system F family protein [Arthrobacter sp. C152]